MNAAREYVEFLFLNRIHSRVFDNLAGEKWIPEAVMKMHFEDAVRNALFDQGYDAGDNYLDVANEHYEKMFTLNVIETEGDEYTGTFARFEVNNKDSYVLVARRENDVESRIGKLGKPALAVALAALAEKAGWKQAEYEMALESDDLSAEDDGGTIEIPASDRFVTLGHNQQAEIEQSSNDVIAALEQENSVDGDPSARAWMLGQLKAGRELVRAQVVNVWLLEQTVLRVLGTLIEKFKDHAIGAAAKGLVDLLMKYIFGGP